MIATLATEWKETVAPVSQPQAEAIDLSDVLDSIRGFLQRHVIFSSLAQPVVIALWITHTHGSWMRSIARHIWTCGPLKSDVARPSYSIA
jgi:hypothetical protein